MKKETIEEAAGNYSGSILGFNDNQSVMAKHKAFADGASWRINKVWHDATERPNGRDPYLIEYKIFGEKKYNTWRIPFEPVESINDNHGFTRWAYIKDLIPEES